jgi:FlaA1/EpsC-like NDP-sugar epimerase
VEVNVARIVLTPSALGPEVHPETILLLARRLAVPVSQLPSIESGAETRQRAIQLAPIVVEELLLRPSVKIDFNRLKNLLKMLPSQ